MYCQMMFKGAPKQFFVLLAFLLISGCTQISGLSEYSRADEKVCNDGCDKAMRGDGYCDPACKNLACGFDDGDCDNEFCVDGCIINDINDGVCNGPCNQAICDFDGGDCDDGWEPGCVPGCEQGMIGDGECNYECLGMGCGDDGGDCNNVVECSPGCGNAMLGNGTCEEICNNHECFMDNGDCGGGEGCDPGAISCLDDCVPCAMESTCFQAAEICGFNEACVGLRECVAECNINNTEVRRQICENECHAVHVYGEMDYNKLMECLYCHACPVSCEIESGEFCANVAAW